MDINCPYCGTHYELDDLLIPEGNIKVKCRVCFNVFTLNKNVGAFKDELPAEVKNAEVKPEESLKTQVPAEQTLVEHEHASPYEPAEDFASINSAAGPEEDPSLSDKTLKHSDSDDFMQAIMSEIKSAVAEETDKTVSADKSKKNKHNSDSDAVSATQSSSSGKGRTKPFQIVMLIVLIVIFLISAVSVLVHYGIINLPFLPASVSAFLSSL